MQKVKEEFFLSLIFITKWLALSLGGLGIIYFAISLAYNKSYYDPIIKAYDLKITELVRQKNNSETSKERSELFINESNKEIDKLKNIDVPNIQKELVLNSKKIKALNESVIDKYNPFSKRNSEAKKLDSDKISLQNKISSLEKQLTEFKDSRDEETKILGYTEETISEIKIAISVEEKNKERVGTGSLGVLPWLAGILGLT